MAELAQQQQLQQLIFLMVSMSTNNNEETNGLDMFKEGLFANPDSALEQLGPIFQSIYPSESQSKFKQQVDIFVKKKDAEILNICGNNKEASMLGLTNTASMLSGINFDSTEAQLNIKALNTRLQVSGKTLYDKSAELLKLKRTYLNVEMAIQKVKACSEVMETIREFSEKVTDKKYYHAIKILENLKVYHLPKVKEYKFGKLLESSIVDMENKLQEVVNSDKNKWLHEMNHTTHEIGVMTMRRMERRQRAWKSRGEDAGIQRYVSPVVEFVLDEESEDQEHYTIDLKPFFQCLNINTKLGHQAEFRRDFINDRQGQYDNIRPKPDMLDSWTIGPFENMLYDLAGFFIMEHKLYTSSQDFRAKSDVDTLWELTIQDLLKLLTPKVQQLRQNPSLQKAVHDLFESFTYIMEEYSYNVRELRDIMPLLLL